MPSLAGAIIDAGKLGIFKKHLDDAGYTYTVHPGVIASTLTLQIEYTSLADLQPIIKAANEECANVSRQH